MITRNLLISLSWISLVHSGLLSSQKVQFLPQPTSFTSRVDRFITNGNIRRSSRNFGDDFFSNSSPEHIDVTLWQPNHGSSHGVYHYNSLSFAHNFDGHITPDFSDGLSHPDPFLRTGIEAKRRASYLYSKELFFHNIPHVKGLLYNQEERSKNGLMPHRLGSLRPASPWYRFKGEYGLNRIFI